MAFRTPKWPSKILEIVLFRFHQKLTKTQVRGQKSRWGTTFESSRCHQDFGVRNCRNKTKTQVRCSNWQHPAACFPIKNVLFESVFSGMVEARPKHKSGAPTGSTPQGLFCSEKLPICFLKKAIFWNGRNMTFPLLSNDFPMTFPSLFHYFSMTVP